VRLVLDTNLIVSFAINPASPVAEIVHAIMSRHTVLYSSETIVELAETFSKPKLARRTRS
jgi:predicted nucleic acid-binding protein